MDSLILRLTANDVRNLAAGKKWPEVFQNHSCDLIEIELDDTVLARIDELNRLFPGSAVLSAVIKINKDDVDSELRPTPAFQQKLESLFGSPFDILCLTSDYDSDKGYYPTTDAVPAVHRFLVEQKLRHRFSILAAGGIRSAADSQKTIQRGANGIKIDWPVLLTADPMARQRFLKGEADPDFTTMHRHWQSESPTSSGSGMFRSSRSSAPPGLRISGRPWAKRIGCSFLTTWRNGFTTSLRTQAAWTETANPTGPVFREREMVTDGGTVN